MTTLSTIRQTVFDWIEDDSDPTLVNRTINGQLRFLCKREFESLYRSANVTPSESGVIIVPPACGTVLGIYPETAYGALASFDFTPNTTRPMASKPRTNRYLYHPYESTRTDEVTGLIFGGEQGNTTLTRQTGTNLTEDMLGKELQLAGDDTRYLIVSVTLEPENKAIDVFPSLRLIDSSELAGTVNPSGLKRYVLTSPSGSIYTNTVTIDYQIDHPPLVLNDDELLIPMERTLALLTVQQFLQQSKYDVDAERLQNAIFEARLIEYGTEPSNQQDNAPTDTMFAFRSKRGRRARR